MQSRTIPSCAGCSTRCSAASSTPSPRSARSSRRSFELATQTAPTLTDIEEARRRLASIARVTPVYGSETLSRLAGREVWLKAENLQRTGAFKIRGAVNRISFLDPDERAAGVVTASARNHGQAVGGAAGGAGGPARHLRPPRP